MRIFGLHWSWHLLYLALLAGLGFFGKNRLREMAILKNEIGTVQQTALPKIQNIRHFSRNEIVSNEMAFPTPLNKELSFAAERAVKIVDAFEKKCDAANERLRNGTHPAQINWRTDLLDDFYQLGDSLAIVYGQDSARQFWLDRCLYSAYRDFPPEQLAALLAASDTADAVRICQNLHLKAELALLLTLETLRKKARTFALRFDGLMPVIAPHGCPRAGMPFKAEIYLVAYSSLAENLSLKVNEKSVPIEAGVGRYAKIFTGPGEHTLPVEIRIRNPLTNEMKIYMKDFVAFVSDTTKMR